MLLYIPSGLSDLPALRVEDSFNLRSTLRKTADNSDLASCYKNLCSEAHEHGVINRAGLRKLEMVIDALV